MKTVQTTDPFNLQRFVNAQESVYDSVLAELREGDKQGHWMWYIFPQIHGLGYSFASRKFAISGLPEAKAYLDHPVLGARLRECTSLVNAVEGKSIHQIFGYPDDLKFRSCMTLFAQATPDSQVFLEALAKYYRGETDPATLDKL